MYKVALSQYCRQSTLCLVWCEVYYCARTAQLYMAEERGLFLSVLNYLSVALILFSVLSLSRRIKLSYSPQIRSLAYCMHAI